MMIQLNPPMPLLTPKGEALCHFLIDEGVEHNLMWVCFLNENGQCWTFQNPEIRASKNITMHRYFVDPVDVDDECIYGQ